MRKLMLSLSLVLLIGILVTGVALAEFAEKPITYVVHTGPGDGADIFARNVMKIAEDNGISIDGQPVYVQNKPGGSGIVAFLYVANQEGSPYYLVPAQNSLITRPLTHGGDFHWSDFTMIANLVENAKVLVVNAGSDYNNVDDLNDAADNDRLTIGGGLQGGSDSIVAYRLAEELGGDTAYVPFGGGGEAVTALLGNDIDVLVTEPMEVASVREAGKVRIIGVASGNRNPSLPDIPTLQEQGYDVTITSHRGVAAPGNLPEDAKAKLIQFFKEITETDDWDEFIIKGALVPSFLPGEEFADYMAKKEETLVPILKAMKLIK